VLIILSCFYPSCNVIVRHMVQSGKKNLAFFQSLRKEMAAKAKAAGKTDVPNL